MSRKPSFAVAKRLKTAKLQLQKESEDKVMQTTILLEASLLYAVKELALKRRRGGIKPNTLTGMVKEALQETLRKENK